MTKRAANCETIWSGSAGAYRRPQTPNPSWRQSPARVPPHVAAEICITEVEGNWLRWLKADDALPYSEVA